MYNAYISFYCPAAETNAPNCEAAEASDWSRLLWIKDYPTHTDKHGIMFLSCFAHRRTGALPADKWYFHNTQEEFYALQRSHSVYKAS